MKLEDKMRKEIIGNLPQEERDDEIQIREAHERARIMSETVGKIAKDITPGKLSDEKYRKGINY